MFVRIVRKFILNIICPSTIIVSWESIPIYAQSLRAINVFHETPWEFVCDLVFIIKELEAKRNVLMRDLWQTIWSRIENKSTLEATFWVSNNLFVINAEGACPFQGRVGIPKTAGKFYAMPLTDQTWLFPINNYFHGWVLPLLSRTLIPWKMRKIDWGRIFTRKIPTNCTKDG